MGCYEYSNEPLGSLKGEAEQLLASQGGGCLVSCYTHLKARQSSSSVLIVNINFVAVMKGQKLKLC